jgi:enamine deaminase RidA (YjgF/YER057c/UK114 family)
MAKCTINRYKSFTIYSSHINKDQVYITASIIDKNANPVSTFLEMYGVIIDLLTKEKMNTVAERIYGSVGFYSAIVKTRGDILQNNGIDVDLPFTYIQGQPYWGEGIAGIQISAVASVLDNGISTIYENGIPVGRKWIRNGATFLMLQNIYYNQFEQGQNTNRELQACQMFERTQKILTKHSTSYRNVVRTWIFLSDILDWYTGFNKVRNSKYQEFGLLAEQPVRVDMEQIYLPASTGIFGLNPYNAAAVMDVLAVVPGTEACVHIRQMSGTKQSSPFCYGSAFSRAMNIHEPDNTTILLSGTASIDKNGKSVYIGDPKSQIIKTLEIADALVHEEGASLNDICTATVFLKRSEDFAIYQKTFTEYGFDEMPAICTIADICRNDLLFELDATFAFTSNTN